MNILFKSSIILLLVFELTKGSGHTSLYFLIQAACPCMMDKDVKKKKKSTEFTGKSQVEIPKP